jgi:DNA-binding PadR family transcriptional regulator
VTAEPHTSGYRVEDGPDGGADAGEDRRRDLSAAFGHPAAASLAGLLPPRPRRSTEQTTDRPEPATGPAPVPAADVPVEEPAPAEPATPAEVPEVPAPRSGRKARPARTARTAPAAPPAATGTGTANRRWGTARLASQEHVELLVLVALRRGPADGRELVARLRADSGGGLDAPPTTVQRTLHHLLRHGLVERAADPERRRFRLTEMGIRVTRARVRAWRALRRAVDAVLDADDQD